MVKYIKYKVYILKESKSKNEKSNHNETSFLRVTTDLTVFIRLDFSFLLFDSFNIYIYIYFIIQRVKARAIPCPHQPPTKGDNTVSVAQGGSVTPGTT